jgi:hypothetical protein
VKQNFQDSKHIHIFLRPLECLVLTGLSNVPSWFFGKHFEYTGAVVPPEGPLVLLLSFIFAHFVEMRQNSMERFDKVLKINASAAASFRAG